MKRITKHVFEAVSLLIADNGQLEITIIPAAGQPDWIIPSTLILDTVDYNERVWSYLWQEQDISVCHLMAQDESPTTLLVIEGNTDVHRVGLQISGSLRNKKVRISDVKDSELPDCYVTSQNNSRQQEAEGNNTDSTAAMTNAAVIDNDPAQTDSQLIAFDARGVDRNILSYLLQCVKIDDEVFLIPDLDKLAHHLVDLDS